MFKLILNLFYSDFLFRSARIPMRVGHPLEMMVGGAADDAAVVSERLSEPGLVLGVFLQADDTSAAADEPVPFVDDAEKVLRGVRSRRSQPELSPSRQIVLLHIVRRYHCRTKPGIRRIDPVVLESIDVLHGFVVGLKMAYLATNSGASVPTRKLQHDQRRASGHKGDVKLEPVV